MPSFPLQGSIGLAALLLASLAPAQARDWDLQAGVSSAQVVRGLGYIDQPLAEVAGTWWSARGWSVGAAAASALHASQGSASANVGYGWPVSDGVDAYVALARSAYRRAGGWRLRYDDARVSLNLHDRLFLSLHRSFNPHSRMQTGYWPAYAAGYGSGSLAKEAVWRQPLPHGLTLAAGAGHAALRGTGGMSYWYGSLGVRAVVGQAELEATWIDSGAGPRRWWGSQAGQRWVGSVRWNF